MAEIKLKTPLTDEDVEKLKIGDKVLITGVIYTGRDAAHKRLFDLIQAGKALPIDIRGQLIYYVGPAPAKPGKPIGSAGPTTSYRMDAFAPKLMELGLKGMIGKGNRGADVVEAMKKFKAVYFGATGGCRGSPGPEHQESRDHRLRGPGPRGHPAPGGGGLPRRGHQRHEGQRPLRRGG